MTHEEIEKRVERAKALFKQGFNCSQAVCAACADLYGIDEPTALRVAASFGGGIGRMRQTCGAACGMFILAGLENGSAIPGDHLIDSLTIRFCFNSFSGCFFNGIQDKQDFCLRRHSIPFAKIVAQIDNQAAV